MNKLFTLLLVVFLYGCNATSKPEVQVAKDNQHQAASQFFPNCTAAPEVGHDFDCEEQQGVFQVTHPADEISLSVFDEFAQVQQPEPQVQLPETDLWQRVRKQLTFHIPDNRRVAAQKRWYLKHPEYMQRVNKRAAPFLHLIVEELEKHNMPLELTLLPIVESAFDPFAYSHGRAAGMWQFVPGTGKRFGMKQTWWYDGRRDVMASTLGAIKYMNYLHKYFDGNWLHALAAYNSGEGRVKRAIRNNKKRGKPTDFWSLDLPRETRAYVPKLLALTDILLRHDELNFKWPQLQNQAVTEVVDIGSQIDLAFAAQLAGLTVEQLHALNPGYNRWATDPKGPHYLLLPKDKAESFSSALAKVDNKQRLNWVRHKIRNGDSLLKLSKKYHTTVDVIRQVNEMRGNTIVAGEHLLIPVALKSLDYYSLSQEQRLASTQSKKRGSHKLTHKVSSGDTMWDISRKYKVNLRSLAKWNGMAPTDPLKPGMDLVVWLNKVSKQHTDKSVVRSLTYTVRNGDSLARIASKFKVKIKDISRWNQLNPKKYLQPGQKLKLFVDVTRT